MSVLGKLLRLSWRDRTLLGEAVLLLAVASGAIAVLPFKQVAAIAARPIRRSHPPKGMEAATISRIQWALAAASPRAPWRTVCFQQGLAAHLMLRRRGIPTVIFYGAAQAPDAGLSAHVWVRAGELDVVGCETASGYAVLATFPRLESAQARPASV
jgi:hypothetical protein